jgi:diaminopimelate decarboxylase
VGDAGVLITRVLYVKRNQRENFVVVDAGMNDLMRPTLYGSYHEIVPARTRAPERLLADIVGPLCESGDFFARARDTPDFQPGDLPAVLTVGAYGYVLSSNYNPRPAEVLMHGAEAELIRPRETAENPSQRLAPGRPRWVLRGRPRERCRRPNRVEAGCWEQSKWDSKQAGFG